MDSKPGPSLCLVEEPVARILLCLLCSDAVRLNLAGKDTACAEIILGSHLLFSQQALAAT